MKKQKKRKKKKKKMMKKKKRKNERKKKKKKASNRKKFDKARGRWAPLRRLPSPKSLTGRGVGLGAGRGVGLDAAGLVAGRESVRDVDADKSYKVDCSGYRVVDETSTRERKVEEEEEEDEEEQVASMAWNVAWSTVFAPLAVAWLIVAKATLAGSSAPSKRLS